MVKSPYTGLRQRAYWRTGVVDRHPLDAGDIYIKKFSILPNDRIATAGSCFAQHIARRLRTFGYQVIDTEPAPPGLGRDAASEYGFGLYSARYGNIYTVRQMLQLVQECIGARTPKDPVWLKDGRYYDALRPSVEPKGLPTRDAVIVHRKQHLDRVRAMLEASTIFVFTMGLTETWIHREDETVYPTAPGTIAGTYDPEVYAFKNLTYTEVLEDFLALRELLHRFNPAMRFLLTVSPVPLTATAGHEHVLPATVYSKSVLRAVAGHLAMSFPEIDYFPSYEIIAAHPARGFFYEGNLRSVAPAGVDVVMRSFFDQHGKVATAAPVADTGNSPRPAEGPAETAAPQQSAEAERVQCEEELLEAFAS
jgi:hypothetical protein